MTTAWHDPRGNIIPFPKRDGDDDRHGAIIRAAWRIKEASEYDLTPEREAALRQEVRELHEMLRYGNGACAE